MSAEGTNRPAKRDVIDIDNDEAKREQPADKIVKKETESVPSPDVAQLQQQLLNSDEKFKRMCEMAGEYKERVEFLENIIDNKEGIIGNATREESTDELRKRVAELTKQLEEREARERMEHPQQPIAVLQPPDEKPVIKRAEDPYNIFQSCDSDSPCSMPFDIARDILHALYAKSSLDSLVKSCDLIKSETSKCDSCEKEIIGVTKMFHHFFSKEHAEKMFGRSVSEAAVNYWKEKLEQSNTIAPIDNICHPSLLRSCDPTTPESFTYLAARRILHYHLGKCDMDSLLELCANELFDCEDCGENNLNTHQVFVHFLSTKHTEKMSNRHVSVAAVLYWKDKLIQAESKVTFHNVCHPINIFQLCRSDTPDSISIECASELFKVCHSPRGSGIGKYVKLMVRDRLYCEVCKIDVRMPGGIKHLSSHEHLQKANAVCASSISLTAVNYWTQLFGQRAEAAAHKKARKMEKKEKRAAKKAAAAAAQKHRVQPDQAAKKKAEEAVNATITAAAVAAAIKVMEVRSAAQNRLVQPDAAAAAASDEVKKEIVKVEND